MIRDAEQAGSEGNVTKCQEIVARSEMVEAEKRGLEEKLSQMNEPNPQAMPPMLDEMAIKPMEVNLKI